MGTIERDINGVIACEQVRSKRHNRLNRVHIGVNRGVEPGSVETEVIVSKRIWRSRDSSVVIDLNRHAGVLTSNLSGFLNDKSQEASQEIRERRADVRIVRCRQGRWEETQTRFNLTRSDHDVARKQILNSECPVHAEVEHLFPHVTRTVGPNGELKVTCQSNWRGTDGQRTSVNPDIVVELEHAAIGERPFNGGGQVGSVGHVENKRHGAGKQVEL